MKSFNGPFWVQVIDRLMCHVDILCQINLAFCQPNHNRKRSEHAHTNALSCRFPSSFPIDVPQWHWCCTSSCLTSEFSSLSSGLHILSEVFLARLPENTGLFAYKGAASLCVWSVASFKWGACSSSDTSSLLNWSGFDMKYKFCVRLRKQEKEP